MMRDLKAACERILELSEKATPGPWDWSAGLEIQAPIINGLCTTQEIGEFYFLKNMEERRANAELCAHTRTTAPAIAQALLRCMEALEWYGNKQAYEHKIFANVGGIDVIACDLVADQGQRAREALGMLDER